MASEFDKIERYVEYVKKESQNAVEDYKKMAPEFWEKIEELFSFNLNLQKTNARLVHLVMEYAEHPQNAKGIIPSIMATLKCLRTSKKEYDRSKKFPDLFPYYLKDLRKHYEDNKELLNEKIWLLICMAKITTRKERSIWYSLSGMGDNTGQTRGPI